MVGLMAETIERSCPECNHPWMLEGKAMIVCLNDFCTYTEANPAYFGDETVPF